MDQAALLAQLQAQLPDFWSKKINGLPTLLSAYSFVYGSALQKWKMIQNELSPFTTDPFFSDFYKVIDLRKTEDMTYYGLQNDENFFYALPDGTFNIDVLSRDIYFTTSINYNIFMNTNTKKSFLQISPSDLVSNDHYLYIRKYDIDNDNMIKTWGSLFPGLMPYKGTNYPNSPNDTYLNNLEPTSNNNSNDYYNYLLNIKAQICAFIRCATLGGSLDALENIFAIVLGQQYVTENGKILAFDNNTTTIEFDNGTIETYNVPPKAKFQQQNAKITPYECIPEPFVRLYDYNTKPSTFIQFLLANNAIPLFDLLTLKDNEIPRSLYFDMPHIEFDNNLTFDFGVTPKPSDAEDVSTSYSVPRSNSSDVHLYTDWNTPEFSLEICQLFKNVVIAEILGSSSKREDFFYNVLEYFRPLHCKYYLTWMTANGGGEGT